MVGGDGCWGGGVREWGSTTANLVLYPQNRVVHQAVFESGVLLRREVTVGEMW